MKKQPFGVQFAETPEMVSSADCGDSTQFITGKDWDFDSD
jgi:hypothetical protein